MIVLQSILLFFHMCLVPYLIGRLVVNDRKSGRREGIAYTMAAGLLVSYALYEVLMLLLQKLGQGFRMLSYTYLVLTLVVAFAGAAVWLLQRRNPDVKKKPDTKRKHGKQEFGKHGRFGKPDPYLLAAIVLIVIQIGAILLMATPDRDDAFYSGLSSMSLSRDEILAHNAYDGRMKAFISDRYKVSALPVYQASLSLFSGMHHLTITHNLFPLFYMPLVYALYYAFGKRFLEKEGMKQAAGKFLLAFALLHMIGNYYVFSPENFLVTRLWQGKALFVALGVPMLFLCGQRLLLCEADDAGIWYRLRQWLLLACILLACAFMGETGLFLAPFMLGCMTLSACLITKKWIVMFPAVLCCIPELVLFIKYLM